MERRSVALGLVAAAIAVPALGAVPIARDAVPVKTVGRIEPVFLFRGAMPTGVAVSRTGRIFVNYPRWGDPVRFTVAELRNGREVPYPSMQIQPGQDDSPPADHLVSVQSVVVDSQDRLWILDTGSVKMGPSVYGGPKLVGVDLKTDRPFRKIRFPRDVVPSSSYLNDVRFDLRRGKSGTAYITDSSASGPNGIVVVDLATGDSWRRLAGHPSVRPEPRFVPVVEGKPLLRRPPRGPAGAIGIGSDGIALSPDGKTLYYCPLSSRRLYSVSAEKLADRHATEDEAAATVRDLGLKGASDGLVMGSDGRLFAGDYEHDAITVREPDGRYRVLVRDPRILWPDTLALGPGRALYFTANQLHRQPLFHRGKDLRRKPYVLFRTRL